MRRPAPWFERPAHQPRGRQTLMTWQPESLYERAAPVALVVITGIAMGFALACVVGALVFGALL